jgi:hypothetical protein
VNTELPRLANELSDMVEAADVVYDTAELERPGES